MVCPMISRGQIYFVNLSPTQGREPAGRRPVLVVSSDAINRQPLVVTVAVGTNAANITRDYPTNIRVTAQETGLPKRAHRLDSFSLPIYFNQGRLIMIKSKKTMIHHLPITKARVNLGHVVRRVHVNKEYFILEKDGIPVAGILDADELEDYLELQDPAIRQQIAESNADIAAGRVRPASEFLAELKRMKAAKSKRSVKR